MKRHPTFEQWLRTAYRPIKGADPTATVNSEREVLDERNRLITQMRGILDTADSETRALSAEEQQEFDRQESDVRDLDSRLERIRKLSTIDSEQRDLLEAAGADLDDQGQPVWNNDEGREDDERLDAERRTARGLAAAATANGRDARRLAGLNEWRRNMFAAADLQFDEDYRAAFYAYLSRRSRESMTMDEKRALAKGGSAANLVPIELERTLIEKLRDMYALRALANVFTTSTGDDLTVPRVTAHGAAAWVGEAQAYTEADDTFDAITFKAYKAGTMIRASEEVLEDSAFDLEAYITGEFDLRIGELENIAYISGDGTGKPTGVVQDAAIGVTGAVGQTLSVTADNLVDLVYAVRLVYRSRGNWLIGDTTVAAVRKLKDTTGQYLWQPGLQAGQPDTLLGYRLYTDAAMPVMAANAKSVLFGDFSKYWIRDVRGIRFQRLDEKYADQGQVGFRAYHRTDGRLLVTEAVKAYKNSAT